MGFRRRPTRFLTALALIASLMSCSNGDRAAETPPQTESERDSTIATSKLPGAGTVGKALDVADSARARANRSLPESN